MPRLKRTRDEAELDMPQGPELPQESIRVLERLRNMWEFACLMQYIYLFGSIVKIEDDFDIEDLESECLAGIQSQRLAEIGLKFLKYISSHRGLTLEIFDEYTRRQYIAKAPSKNPFGDEEEPRRFNDFDVFTKIRVLHQLSLWTLINADRFRGVAPVDEDMTSWRMEPLGWDKDDHAYFVLDDNRLYRRVDLPIPPPPPKTKAKSKGSKSVTAASNKSRRVSRGRATRTSKRLKTSHDEEDDDEMGDEVDISEMLQQIEDQSAVENGTKQADDEPGYGFTSKTWKCVAITLDDYRAFVMNLAKTKDPNEKQLRKRIEEQVMPVLEKRAEQVRQKQLKKLRELENLQRMATAKRSSRLADKADREKEERERQEAEERHARELKLAREEEARQRRIEEGHESRRQTREQRLREREAKRVLHEAALDKLREQEDRAASQDPLGDGSDEKRVSHRHTKAQREQLEKELAGLADEESKWYFDCSKCGMHGENLDDGSHSIACDKCGVWQHSKCHNIAPEQAERTGFRFVCKSCRKKEEEAKRPRPTIKLAKHSVIESPKQKPEVVSQNEINDARTVAGVYVSNPKAEPSSEPPGSQQSPGLGETPDAKQMPTNYPYPAIGNFALRRTSQESSTASGAVHLSPIQHHRYVHQSAHQNAVLAAGGHSASVSATQQAALPNGTSPHLPSHRHPSPITPQSHHSKQRPAEVNFQQYQPPDQSSDVRQRSNTVSSPVKLKATPALTTPQPLSRPVSQQSNYAGSNLHLPHSPKTTFPPPVSASQQNGYSPIKSSPPSSQETQRPTASFTQTPQTLRPSTTSDTPAYHTPRAASSNGIAADGMSGPWPEHSTAIPQKHDQSPSAASVTDHSMGETRILPPVAALVPSPNQAPRVGPDTIPVKKPVPEEHEQKPMVHLDVNDIKVQKPELLRSSPSLAYTNGERLSKP